MDVCQIVEAFDARAARYRTDDWHKRYAEQLVAVAPIGPGDFVLDAGTGTGFAALAIARRVGPAGRVTGVDISPGMLREARSVANAAGVVNVEYLEADACDLQHLAEETFDAVVCSAGLLYMAVPKALREWRRLLKPGGNVAFSSMRQGSPSAGRIFRECAQQFGLSLADPSESLGTEERCCAALRDAGYDRTDAIAGSVEFETLDPTLAWEANLRSAGHAPAQLLTTEEQDALKHAFLRAIRELIQENLPAAKRADVIFAIGRRDDG